MEKNHLFDKVILNNGVEVQNRLAVAPVTIFSCNDDGTINDEEREYLKMRGTNIGLYILGAATISQEGINFKGIPRIINEKDDLPSLAERAKIIKSQGALAINQIHHGGGLSNKEFSGMTPVVPSADVYSNTGKEVHELTGEEIKKLIEKFAYATELSIKAGYDGVEIHGANNFLIQQFYSAHTNHRTDEWGGSSEKRMNFSLQIVDAVCKVKEKYNVPKFIIGYRLSPEEPYQDGLNMTETLKLVRALVNKPLQYIHISQNNFFRKARNGEGAGTERLKLIHEITKGKMALIGVGGLKSERDLKTAAETGFCEFIAVGIAIMLNRDFGLLLKEGKGDKLNLELDPEHPEKYSLPKHLWDMCMTGQDWLPPVKGQK